MVLTDTMLPLTMIAMESSWLVIAIASDKKYRRSLHQARQIRVT